VSDAYVGEIRCFGFNFAPVGWFQCNGQLLPIQSYAALFSIIEYAVQYGLYRDLRSRFGLWHY
jgi:microcystin-dependent protein